MSQPKLPAQVRVHVRDLINDPDSEVQQALKSVNSAIGSGFSLEIAWNDIYRDLKSSFKDDIDELVPAVGSHITVFLQRLESVLEQDEKFQEKFLEDYPGLNASLRIVVQAGTKTSSKIVGRKITILLPTTDKDGFRFAKGSVGADIPDLFREEKEDETMVASASQLGAKEDEDWDRVDVSTTKSGNTNAKQDRLPLRFNDPSSVKPYPLPKIKALRNPEVLFRDVLPAYLTIRGNDRELYIEGSHAPTISLIGEYFKNYARKEMTDVNQAPRFKIEEMTSNFGSGVMSDCIKIELWHHNRDWRLNISLFLSFIEGICGYEMVNGKIGAYVFKRSVPF